MLNASKRDLDRTTNELRWAWWLLPRVVLWGLVVVMVGPWWTLALLVLWMLRAPVLALGGGLLIARRKGKA